jgi:hypothetical protein
MDTAAHRGQAYARVLPAAAGATGTNVASHRSGAGLASEATAAREPAHLFKIAASCEPAHPDRIPPQLGHHLRQPPVRAGTPGALRHFNNSERSLSGDALDTVVADLTVQAFQ